MAKINLLPWRAERRDRRKREFITQLIIAAVAAVVLVLLWGFWMSLRIDNQGNRNAYMQGQIKQLDAKISEIKSLQQVKDHLLARKKIIEKLQSSRSQMVHLFDEVVRTIPSGARLTGMTQKGDSLTLTGVAQSNNTVATYMRNLEASPWMGAVKLGGTENVRGDPNTPYQFTLTVSLSTPKAEPTEAQPASASSAAPLPAATPAAATSSVVPATSVAAATVSSASSAAPAMVPASAPPAASAKPVDAPPPMSAPAGSVGAGEEAPDASSAKGRAQP